MTTMPLPAAAEPAVPAKPADQGRVAGRGRGEWPDWRIDEASAAQLARYVSVSQMGRWVPTDEHPPLRTTRQGWARAERLYETLAGRRIPYASGPFNPADYEPGGIGRQRIRGPDETMQGPATCLDLALAFAGMAAAADMRPLIAVRYGASRHAMVVLDLSGPLSAPSAAGQWPAPPGCTQRPGEPGVWEQDGLGAIARLADDDNWLPVNVVEAGRGSDRGFAAASGWRMARGLAQGEPAGSRWVLVDVRRVLAHLAGSGIEPYEPPRGRSVPPIHSYLPPAPAFRDFPTRAPVLRGLQELVDAQEPAVIVIHAPSGYGKSMLARQLAAGADNGCGWFLNATDRRELTRSLAQAERGEHAVGGEQPSAGGEKADANDDQAFAAAALDRLREAERPWVVVVDNCDSPPGAAGLLDLLPRPHGAGQVVIVTTTDPDWLDHATPGHRVELAGLGTGDLTAMLLPPGLADAVGGRPLVATALVALRDAGGVDLPPGTDLDGPDLVWALLSRSARAAPDVLRLARLLAWLPPEPMPADDLHEVLAASAPPAAGALPAGALPAADASPADALLVLGLVNRSASDPSVTRHAEDSPGLLMHRLFSAAVRRQTWRDQPGEAARAISALLTSRAGRWLYISAADATALARLEHGEPPDDHCDAERAVGELVGDPAAGLLWYGLGHVRERRGPVSASGPLFARAQEVLDPAAYPFEVAESMIGQVRVTYQSRATDEQRAEARAAAQQAQWLLASSDDLRARQLREQGNALAWLIERQLAGREPDIAVRAERIAEVRDNLWLSFAERLRMARKLPDGTTINAGEVPRVQDGLGPERAYYNLAGVYIELARLHRALARRAAEAAGRDLPASDDLLAQAGCDLDAAGQVYDVVRALREERYSGRAHPHLAACLNGLAIVGYFRAVLLGERGELAGAAEHAGAGLEQRRRVAGSLVGPGSPDVLRDGDVGKSFDLLLKTCVAAVFSRYGDDTAAGADAVRAVLREATREWLSGPGSGLAAEPGVGQSAMLSFDHELRLEFPPGALSGFDRAGASARIQNALARIGPLAQAAADIKLVDIRQSSTRPPQQAADSLDVVLALPGPAGARMDEALRWAVAGALGLPGTFTLTAEAPDSTDSTDSAAPGAPSEDAVADTGSFGRVVVAEPPPRLPGHVEAGPPRRRYLRGRCPDIVQAGREFSLQVSVAQSGGTLMKPFDVPAGGLSLLLVAHAPGLRLVGTDRQTVRVPHEGDSEPVKFDLVAAGLGVRQISVTAWDGGTYLGELLAEVSVDRYVRELRERTVNGEIGTEHTAGEVTLEVRRDQGQYTFRFHDDYDRPDPVAGPLNDPGPEVEDLVNRLDELAEGAGGYNAAQAADLLRDEGIQLWDQLMPLDLRRQFWERRHRISQLTILADNDVVPWELLYPLEAGHDEGFLVLQFPVTRRLSGLRLESKLRLRPARFVLPDNSPKQAEAEVNALCQLLDPGRVPATVRELTPLRELILRGGFGLLHFACHDGFGAGPSIMLDLPFSPVRLAEAVGTRSLRDAPLVFINACRSAGQRRSYTRLDSFAEKFMRAGAGAFIGSLWEVRDGTAREFAQEMYGHLLSGESLGAAAMATRLAAKNQPDDPTWLAYSVYGDPQATIG